ncbi:relaxase domain-containing protein [Bradyrhizobium sp. STM 3557]|uniref:relaxase domain-containing protein n=1 Tax=Bradyrhizobium sp. STM 3557 TaxID=578920 RepID=UPI0038903809
MERAFSKRRRAIEEAAEVHGYSTPKGIELATLYTRRPERDAKLAELIKHWQREAKALGFELGRRRDDMRTTSRGLSVVREHLLGGASPRPRFRRRQPQQLLPSQPSTRPPPSSVLVSAGSCAPWINRPPCLASGSTPVPAVRAGLIGSPEANWIAASHANDGL